MEINLLGIIIGSFKNQTTLFFKITVLKSWNPFYSINLLLSRMINLDMHERKIQSKHVLLNTELKQLRLLICRVLFYYFASSLDYTSFILLDLSFLVHVLHCIQQNFIALIRICGNDLLTCRWANK